MSELPEAISAEKEKEKEKEKYFHPETGEEISKNAWKKLQKGGKVKKEKPAAPLPKKEKKRRKEERSRSVRRSHAGRRKETHRGCVSA